MVDFSPDFTLDVEGVKGSCPAGEDYANRVMGEKKIPVLSCEGPCIRGEIARLAANMVARDVEGLARACHAESFLVPHSAMSAWIKSAEKIVMIDGCFLQCNGRVLRKLVDPEKVIQIDTNPLHKKYAHVFLMDDVPEDERKAVARQVADKVIETIEAKLPTSCGS